MCVSILLGENDVDCGRSYAAELVARAPDVILAADTPSVDVRHRGKAQISDSIFCVMQFRISFLRQRAA
jgi:hypothetical protein